MEIDIDAVHEYILKRELKKENPTIFLLKELTSGISNLISNEATTRDKNGHFKVLLGETVKIQMEHCVIGWRNLKDKKGNEIPYSNEVKPKLPTWMQTELMAEIDRISTPTEEEIKN